MAGRARTKVRPQTALSRAGCTTAENTPKFRNSQLERVETNLLERGVNRAPRVWKERCRVPVVKRIAAALFLIGALGASSANAAPILLSTTLTGDPRPENPDNLRVLVSVIGDTLSNIAYWTVDLDMAAYHPNARLDEFGFNLLGAASNYAFNNFNLPYTPVTGTLNGSGGTTFLLMLNDPNGNRYDASNVTSLTFQVRKSTGAFTLDDFVLAPVSCSNNSLLGCNQLGAHLQALSTTGGQSDSGAAVGNYRPPPPPPVSVPEPGTLVLLGLGVVAAAARRT